MLIPKTAGCGVIDDWGAAQGIRHKWNEGAQVGDLVLFDFAGNHTKRDHVGTVIAVGSGTITTIEGNTGTGSEANGGAVMERQRSLSVVTSFIRPRWTSELTAAKLVAIEKAEVGVKESPADSNNVKYNTWYYGKAVSGSAYPWCMAFQAWCHAMLAGEISGGSVSGGSSGAPAARRTACKVDGFILRRGCEGEGVITLQAALQARGYDIGPDGIDGDFGAKTEEAVRKYQAKMGLLADGEAGALTLAKLLAI